MSLKKHLLLLFIGCFACIAYASVEHIGIIIGNNRGLQGENTLSFATRDASEVCNALVTIGNFDKDRVYLMLDQNVTAIVNTFREVTGRVKELKHLNNQVLLFVYYSGHGSDGALHINGTKMDIAQLRDIFTSLDAELRIMVVDACQSGSMLDIKGGTIAPPLTITLDEQLKTSGTVILSSSSRGEQSHESKELRGSVFTSHFLTGLKGAADFDRNYQVSLWEAFSYANTGTALTGLHQRVEQHPGFSMDIEGTRDIYLSNISKSQSVIAFENCQSGIYDIIDEQLLYSYARVNIEDNDTVRIAVPSGRYIVKTEKNDRLLIASVDCTWGGRKPVTSSQLRPFHKDTFFKKGGVPFIKNHALFAGCQFGTGVPDELMILPSLGYAYSFYKSQIGMQVGFTKKEFDNTYAKVKRTFFSVSVEADYFIINKSRIILSAGLGAGYYSINQALERYNEQEIAHAGYSSISDIQAHCADFNVPVNVQVQLPLFLFAAFSIHGGVVAARNSSDVLTAYPDIAAGIRIGRMF
jgi:hypothetical protein